jgi:hypothetical protein
MVSHAAAFAERYRAKVESWRRDLERIRYEGGKTVVWGGGSKGVTFLNTLDIRDGIDYVVDINPYKHGKYLPGTGQKIVPPEFLIEYRPSAVIVMNPVYLDEVREMIGALGLSPEVIPV